MGQTAALMMAFLPRRSAVVLLALGVVAATGGVVGASLSRAALHRPTIPLPDYGVLPDFSLIDHEGKPFTRAALDGQVWIADFIFTRCAGQCPLMSDRMARLQETFATAAALRLVSFSVDPGYDTPSVLASYAKRYGAHDGRWVFVTGDGQAVARLAQEGFRLGVADGQSAAEPIAHSVRLVLVDRQGHIRGYYDAVEEEAIRRLVTDVKRLLQTPA